MYHGIDSLVNAGREAVDDRRGSGFRDPSTTAHSLTARVR